MDTLVLLINEGANAGSCYTFTDVENILIGRDDPTSQATLRLGPDDPYLSRHHFMLEWRPPNCLLRDQGSKGGTYLKHKDAADWHQVAEALLTDGDLIRAGRTIIQVELNVPSGISTLTQEEDPDIAALVCVRCGNTLVHRTVAQKTSYRDVDLMCEDCCHEVLLERTQAIKSAAPAGYRCHQCDQDVTDKANQDECAIELSDITYYLCDRCAYHKCNQMGGIEIVGDYLKLTELGRGGMGVVYKGWHQLTGRVVAIKELRPISQIDKKRELRFLREISIMHTLRHPNIIHLIEAGQTSLSPYLISEYVPGGNLSQFLHDTDLASNTDLIIQLVADTLDGLGYLHTHGYVHRDIKPENILIHRDSETPIPKLADFGLARSYEEHGGTITEDEMAGTPPFISLEQLINFRSVGPAADVYAMGVVFYYLLTGNYPLDFLGTGENRQGRVKRYWANIILEDIPRPIKEFRPDLPYTLQAVIDTACRKVASDRYSSAVEFKSALLASLN